MIVKTKNYKLEKKKYISMAMKMALRKQWWAWLIVVAIAGAYFIPVVSSWWWIFGAVTAGGLYLLFWWVQFYGVTQLEQGKILFERYSYEITSRQLILKKNAREGMPLKWEQIKYGYQTADSYVLFLSRAQLIHLPFKIFNTDNERKFVASILKQKRLIKSM